MACRALDVELFAPVAAELAELYLASGRPAQCSLIFPSSGGGYLRRHN